MAHKKEIEEVLLFQIERTSKLSKVYSQRIMDKSQMDITIEQWILLKIIEEGEDISQKELADFSLRDPASITRSLKILENKNLISKSPTGKRQFMLKLTKKGNDFIKRNMPIIQSLRQKSMANITPSEIDTFLKTLKKIQGNFT